MGVRAVGGAWIDFDGYQVASSGMVVELTRVQRDLLAVLTDHVGELVSYEALGNAAWHTSNKSHMAIRNAIYVLRRLLRRVGARLEIKVVRGRGYVLRERQP